MKRKSRMLRVVPASQAKNNFGEVIKRRRAWQSLMKFLDSVPEVDIPEEEVEADIQKAVDEIRHGKRKP